MPSTSSTSNLDDKQTDTPGPPRKKTTLHHALFIRGPSPPPPPQPSPAPTTLTSQTPSPSKNQSKHSTSNISAPNSFLHDRGAHPPRAVADAPLTVALPGGAEGFRAPLLSRNWIHKTGGKVKTEEGLFMAILVDHARIPLPTAESLRRSLGFDPLAHDSVIFFERKGRRLAGNFGAVVRESWSMWNKAAYECFAARDRGAAEAFQDFLEGEVFGWLECEACGRWRMYPREDVLLPREGSVFVCDLAYSWNPAIQGCQTEQEFSIDSVGTGSTNSSTAAPILPAERPAIPKQFEAQIDTAHAETLGGASSVTARRLLGDSKDEGKQWKERGKGSEGLGEAYGRPPKKKAS